MEGLACAGHLLVLHMSPYSPFALLLRERGLGVFSPPWRGAYIKRPTARLGAVGRLA